MAHVAHHGLASRPDHHGNRRNKQQHSRNFEAMFGREPPRRSGGGRPQIRSQYSSGIPMGAYRGVSVSSAHSEYSRQGVACNLRVCLRAVSVLVLVTGALMLAFGLFLEPGFLILGLCIPGGLMIVVVLLIWCVMYVWHGNYCIKSSDSATLNNQGAVHRPARSTTEEATVDLRLSQSTSGEVMSSYGPNTRLDSHHPLHAPPGYSPLDTHGSFPVTGRRSVEQPPSTPPPPYDEVT